MRGRTTMAAQLGEAIALRHLHRYATACEMAHEDGADAPPQDLRDVVSRNNFAERYVDCAEVMMCQAPETLADIRALVIFALTIVTDEPFYRLHNGTSILLADKEHFHLETALSAAAQWLSERDEAELGHCAERRAAE